MKNVILMKKEGYLGLTYTWGWKPLKIWWRKRQNFLDWIGRSRRESKEKVEKAFWNSEEHVRRSFFKNTHWPKFDRSKISFDRSKNRFDRSSINQASIEPGKLWPKFLSHFWLVKQWLRSVENLENSNFWKIEQFNVETPKCTLFHEWNAWVWD